MDLKKFITRQRLQTTAVLALLSGKQSFFIDKMSQMLIRESSNFEETSEDEELSDWGMDDQKYAEKLAKSEEKVDQRLIDLYMIRRAHQIGSHFGFDNQSLLSMRAQSLSNGSVKS